jgi:peptide/nickel transport system substrate-binding protein
VRFNLKGANDRELPLIIGLMPIFPKHAIDPATFDKSTLKPPIGSGPYVISEVSAPNYIVYKRNPDYWGKDLPIHRGLFNYDAIRIEYYRDANTMFEAFKKGLYDVNPEGDPAQWNTAYNFPAVNDGKVVKETFKTGTPKGMSGFVFNTRRPVFADKRVRKALATLFDFDWVNKNLYYGAFVRAAGYFNDSELSSIGKPASDKEKALLAPFPGVVDDDVMNGTYTPVSASGADGGRAAMRAALEQLQAAGYALKGNQLINTKTGQQLAFEIMVVNNEDEKLALAYQRTLERIGIKVVVRNVEDAQFQPRLQQFDYDMVRRSWSASLSPCSPRARMRTSSPRCGRSTGC